jgi:hypothetical protein
VRARGPHHNGDLIPGPATAAATVIRDP